MLPGYRFVRGKLSVGLIILVITAFLWINASWIYGPFAEQVRNTFIIYFIFLLIVMVPFRAILPTFGKRESAINFVLLFILTSVVMIALPIGILQTTAQIEIPLVIAGAGFGFLHGFVKAYVEEIVFRHMLPLVAGLGDIISSILFGLFHASVAIMSGNPLPIFTIFFLMLLGFVWSLIRNRWGLMGSTGSHFAYNLAALGVLPLLFGGV